MAINENNTIPKTIPIKEECVIDGEVICTYENFKAFENDYSNPRNFAAGSIRLLDNKECEKRNLTFNKGIFKLKLASKSVTNVETEAPSFLYEA